MLAKHHSTTPEAPAYPVKHRCSQVQAWQTIELTTYLPQKAYLLQYVYDYLTQGHEGNNVYARIDPAATEITQQGVGVYITGNLQPATTTPWAIREQGARVHAYQPTTPCCLPCPDDHNTVIFADAPGTTSFTPAAGGGSFGAADGCGRPTLPTPPHRGHHFRGLLSRGLAIIVDTVTDTHQRPRDHVHHMWVVVDAAVDFQVIRKLAWQLLHKATNSSLGTQALHLWAALKCLPKHVILHLIKQAEGGSTRLGRAVCRLRSPMKGICRTWKSDCTICTCMIRCLEQRGSSLLRGFQ